MCAFQICYFLLSYYRPSLWLDAAPSKYLAVVTIFVTRISVRSPRVVGILPRHVATQTPFHLTLLHEFVLSSQDVEQKDAKPQSQIRRGDGTTLQKYVRFTPPVAWASRRGEGYERQLSDRLISAHLLSSPPLIRTNGDWVHVDLDVSVEFSSRLRNTANPRTWAPIHSDGHLSRYLPVFYLAHPIFDIMETILPIFCLCLIPLSIRYFSSSSQISPSAAELIFLISAFFLLRPPVTSSLIFGTQNTLSNLESIVTQALHSRVFGGHLMKFVYHLLGIQEDLLDFARRCGRTSCGLGDELEDDIESQMHANTPPTYEDLSTPPRIYEK
ncbi:uncharacterized protein LACBIDRAFT_331967 [Laccaria bicolor S238N-H82]|uniref:Predicted protein n=1 Tax=Laccaria bicolor (strain S238N-H82 / ATCC MYA-4686) TaxID=486041 RepID=B0DR67_LACBS|nr:uncharacterized protein LACBIDRAFT_331967 [Laccaria bicolor S238N-H82]EDR03009.1 predicted protein [Laccaria bicolor S238N-H82]|eukprot:XP_001886432.1 predicted protein [Laccaria bicolor S238N-H82]